MIKKLFHAMTKPIIGLTNRKKPPVSGRKISHPSNIVPHSTEGKVSVLLTLLRAIEKSSIQLGKNVRATSFGTILLTIMIMVLVMHGGSWVMLKGLLV